MKQDRPQYRYRLPLTDRICRHKRGNRIRPLLVLSRFNEPTCNVVEEPAGESLSLNEVANLFLLLSTLVREAEIWRIPADVGFPSLVLEVDFVGPPSRARPIPILAA